MSELRFKSHSTSSTQSFESDDLTEGSHDVAPYDLYYDDPERGDSLLVLQQGEAVPCEQTKYKKKLNWSYALKFWLVPT